MHRVCLLAGAAKAVAQSLDSMKGKLSGNAIRVPTPNVSLAILLLDLDSTVSKTELNHFLFKQATYGPYYHQIGYSVNEDAVSTDFVGARSTGVIDSSATIVKGETCCVAHGCSCLAHTLQMDVRFRQPRQPVCVVRQRVRLRVPGDSLGSARRRRRVPHIPSAQHGRSVAAGQAVGAGPVAIASTQ